MASSIHMSDDRATADPEYLVSHERLGAGGPPGELGCKGFGDALHAAKRNKAHRHVLIRNRSRTQQGLFGTFMQGDRASALQPERDAFPRKGGFHRLISAGTAPCDFAENPGIRVAQVTAGTRCYTRGSIARSTIIDLPTV